MKGIVRRTWTSGQIGAPPLGSAARVIDVLGKEALLMNEPRNIPLSHERGNIPLSQDAALVSALAGTAMPFSHSAEDQAERWLRVLRLHGHVGSALQALGVGEAPLMTGSDPESEAAIRTPVPEGDVVERVVSCACEYAAEREAKSVSTPDLLFAIFEVYDRLMDRALYLRGTSRAELLARLCTTGDLAETS